MISPIAIIAVLAVNHVHVYNNSRDYLKKNHVTMNALCQKYKAKDCVIRRESGHKLSDLGFAVEDNTVSWVLYGRKAK